MDNEVTLSGAAEAKASLEAVQDLIAKARERAAISKKRLEHALRAQARSHADLEARRADLDEAINIQKQMIERMKQSKNEMHFVKCAD